jgi:hypothetical protein
VRLKVRPGLPAIEKRDEQRATILVYLERFLAISFEATEGEH